MVLFFVKIFLSHCLPIKIWFSGPISSFSYWIRKCQCFYILYHKLHTNVHISVIYTAFTFIFHSMQEIILQISSYGNTNNAKYIPKAFAYHFTKSSNIKKRLLWTCVNMHSFLIYYNIILVYYLKNSRHF